MRRVEGIEKIEYTILSNGFAQPRPWVGEEINLRLGIYDNTEGVTPEAAHITVKYVGKLGENYAFVKGKVNVNGEELQGEAKFLTHRQYAKGVVMGRLLLRRIITTEI